MTANDKAREIAQKWLLEWGGFTDPMVINGLFNACVAMIEEALSHREGELVNARQRVSYITDELQQARETIKKSVDDRVLLFNELNAARDTIAEKDKQIQGLEIERDLYKDKYDEVILNLRN